MSKRRLPARRHSFGYTYRSASQYLWWGKLKQIMGWTMGGVVGLLLLVGAVGAIFTVMKPTPQEAQLLLISLNKEGRADALAIAHMRTGQDEVELYPIPLDAKITVMGGYGEYSADAMYSLLKLEKKDLHFIQSAYALALGQVIDEVVVLGEPQALGNRAQLQRFFRKALINHPLQTRSLAKWWWFTWGLPSEGVVVKQSASIDELSKQLSQSASQGAEAEENRCSAAVINTVTASGLAAQVAKVLENSRFLVIKVADSSQHHTQTTLYVNPVAEGEPKPCQLLIKGMTAILPTSPRVVTDATTTQQYRAQAVLMIGEDTAESLRK